MQLTSPDRVQIKVVQLFQALVVFETASWSRGEERTLSPYRDGVVTSSATSAGSSQTYTNPLSTSIPAWQLSHLLKLGRWRAHQAQDPCNAQRGGCLQLLLVPALCCCQSHGTPTRSSSVSAGGCRRKLGALQKS